MAKKKRKAPPPPVPRKKSAPAFDPEKSPWFTPAVLVVLFLALVVLFSDFLFSGEMLYGSDMIQAGVFFRSFLVNYVTEHGQVPQWDPYIFCGMPYVDAFHGDIFYPLSFLKFFGSIFRMLGLNLFLHIFLAGIFMYLAARQFRLAKLPSLMSAACYMFAPYLVSLVAPGHDGKIFVTTLFPLVILFLDRIFERRALLNASLMGLVLGVIILSPHPQMSYFTLWAAALYTIFKLISFISEKGIVRAIPKSALAAYAVVLGLLLSAIQFYPGYIYTTEYSPRADAKSGWEWATSWSMHEEEAFSLLIPEFCGTNAQKARTHYWGKNFFKDNSEAVGIAAVFVGLIGLFFSRRREAYFFGGLALFALFYALGATTPVFKIFYYLIPKVKSLRAPSMIMFLFSFSTALLAGFGVQYVITLSKKAAARPGKRLMYLLLGLPGLMLLLALLFSANGRGMLSLWTSLFYSGASQQMVRQGVSKLDLAYANLPAIQSGVWMAFLFSALAALFLWLFLSRKAGTAALLGLVLVPVVDGIRFDSRFVDTFDQDRLWAPNAVTDFFAQRPGHYRVMNLSNTIQEDLLPYHGIPVVTGYHGNQLRWYDELLGGPGARNQTNPRLLNLAGAKYLLLAANTQLPPGYMGDKPLTSAASFPGVQVIQNDNALPRVFLADDYRVFPDRQAIYPEVLNGSENLRQTVYLEREPFMSVAPDTTATATDSVWIVDYAVDSVLIKLSCSRDHLLVLTDNYYDSWQAYADGEPIPVMRAYGTFRAVVVPAGTEQVLFRYESQRYRTGRLVTWLTALFMVGVVAVSAARSAKRRSPRKGPS